MLLLQGCAGGTRAPIEDRHNSSSTTSSSYTVRRGDTLYAIAFRFGQDYRALAMANSIEPPYTIYPGQRIRVAGVDTAGYTLVPRVTRPATRTGSESAAPTPAPVSPPAVAQPTRPPLKSARVPAPPPVAVAPAMPARPANAALTPVSAWRWPSPGPVVRGYSATVHKGIDIGGQRGDPVVAVASGQVVYAGTGIIGFGELLIVKHDDVYLSAYGHNDRLLAAEGDRVTAGQKIAEKGSTGTDSVKLHFEIRREGKPVDPLGLLPRK
ncbi:peptigoglycan-binding protein LysM [Kineobactrum sediminis]|uniref:Peptigoglycan-binding protein LysM n=2 Tax=Kineobactrum sediminis TaxID=1905677 RepID=A0A2N5Y2D5_9GAMM|nr:peptigoglycan-binding protein LysM [Kineobactrum sediminis]